MTNVEGQQARIAAHPTCGGWPNLIIQGRPPCHGDTPTHDRTRWRLRVPLLRQGNCPCQTGRLHARPAARYRNRWLLRGLRPIRAATAFAGVFGRKRTGHHRRRCLRTWVGDAFANLFGDLRCWRQSNGFVQCWPSGPRDYWRDCSSSSRGLAGGAAANAGGDSSLFASPAGGTGRTRTAPTCCRAAAPASARDSPGAARGRHRIVTGRLPRRLPHRDGRLASHSDQRRPAGPRLRHRPHAG